MTTYKSHDRGIARPFGFLCALCMLALAAQSWPASHRSPYLGFAALFALNAFIDSRHPLQASAFLAFAMLHGTLEAASLLCLVAVALAAIIVFRRGWFVVNASRNAAIVKAVGCAALLFPLILSDFSFSAIIPTLIYCGIFLAFARILARGRFLSAFSPKKRVLLLSEYHLTEHERDIVVRRANAISVKDIACELNVSIHSVRNGLSAAYRKLELGGFAELIELGARYQLK